MLCQDYLSEIYLIIMQQRILIIFKSKIMENIWYVFIWQVIQNGNTVELLNFNATILIFNAQKLRI